MKHFDPPINSHLLYLYKLQGIGQCSLGLGLENKSPQIELLRSEPSSSHHIVTIYSSIAHKIKSWICGIGLKDFGRQDQKLIQMQIVP